MKKQFWAATAAGAALLMGAGAAFADDASAAPPFDGVVAFGDSLSDAGNYSLGVGLGTQLSFTTNPGDVAVQNIANHYGIDLNASLGGGSDYAYGGAGVLHNNPGTPGAFPTLTTQVATYLAAHPKIDSDTLFTFWGGANDIFYHATLVAFAAETPQQALGGMAATGAAAGALIDQLQAAGAGTIVVFNLPNTGLTPAGRAAEQGAPGSGLLLTGMALAYNQTLNASLAGQHGIVPVNVYDFFAEVVAAPGAYGLSNITSVACTTASSLTCNAGTLVTANAASTYLFADGVHPTAAGHRAIADLVISELAAPQQMSVLPEAPLIFTGNATLAINTELARRSESSVEGVHLFASGGYTNGKSDGQMIDIPQTDSDGLMVTGGASLTMSNGTTAGLALTLGRTRSSWGDHGGFDTDAAMLTAFGQYGGGDGLYINAQGRVMDLGYNVERTFNLGPLVRTETSNPNGWGAGARLGAGYWFGMGGAMTGPFVSVDYQRISVDGFAEHGSDSSAMTFSEQTRDALVGEVGWAVKGSMQGGGGVWQPFASIAYGYDAKADRQYLTAGLVTLNGDFQMLGYEPEKQWISASAGVSANFGGSWAGHVAYSGRFADEGRQAHGIVVGLSTAF